MMEVVNFKSDYERNKTKVNKKSHQLAYKKLERDLESAVDYVDYENTNLLNLTQVGQLLFILSVFKYLFNEEYEKKLIQNLDKLHVEPIT